MKGTSEMMVSRIVVSFVLAGICLPCVCLAKTTTWTGGSSGLFSAAANWDNGAPAGGDTCVFPDSDVTNLAESVDFGASGLILVKNAGTLVLGTSFSGSGGLVKNGAGTLRIEGNVGTFTGDATINGGALDINAKSTSLGAGKIVFTETQATHPFVTQNTWNGSLSNPIEVRGSSADGQISFAITQQGVLSGGIVSSSDFRVNIGYKILTVSGDISAPGQTMSVSISASSSNVSTTFADFTGSIDANVRKIEKGDMRLAGRSTSFENLLTVAANGCTIQSSGYWAGDVSVEGATSVLRLQGVQNLSRLTDVSVSNGGRLELGAACAVTVASLTVNGQAMQPAVYTAANLPDVIVGEGSIAVENLDALWVGGESGRWSNPDNWSGHQVPASGSVVGFLEPVTLEHETVDIGPDGYTLIVDGALTNHVWFTGEGGLVKRGVGCFILAGDAGGDFAGGVRFEGGVLSLENRRQDPATNKEDGYKFFGTGPVTLVSSAAYRPYVDYSAWNSGLTNQIVISGENLGGNQQGAFYAHQKVDHAVGPIVADSDFKIYQSYYGIQFSSISAPGHTVFVDSYRSTYNVMVTLAGTVNANVTKTGNFGPLTIAGSSPNPANVMTLPSGTNTFSSAAHWGGTVDVSGEKTLLVLQGAGNLSSKTSTLQVSSGAHVNIASGVRVRVDRLVVDGVEKDFGVYSAANLPEVITGSGSIRVGRGLVLLFR